MIEWQPNRLWYHDSPFKQWGIDINLRMSVIRLSGGELLIYNPTALSDTLLIELESLGRIKAIVTVNEHLHHHLSDWWLKFPDAYFFAAPGLELKRTDIGFDAPLSSQNHDLWRKDLYQSMFVLSERQSETIFCDPESKTLIIGTTLAQFNQGSLSRQLLGVLTARYFHAGCSPSIQVQSDPKTLLRQSLQEILSWPFERILPLHGSPIPKRGKHALTHAFSWALNA
ncbi:methanol oxidase [Veronia nyctiphanis]|uniref:Methanol oxidase n=1 Tax=Veronia nyctiphanis TaxID=1278244 RepID=A0A4Q0YTE7_9GAMM|nr:DUF4336 domain-containing protein [Veronia nyctiphanis]RXJ74497.1 methanol oxidase [Veronia nyctiphanis]